MPEQEPDFIDPFTSAEWLPARELFRRLGFHPVPPEEVDDFELPGRLWEFIYALAGRRIFLGCSNHLSDRELYVWLYEKWLPEPTADVPLGAEWNCLLDIAEALEGGDPTTWLRCSSDLGSVGHCEEEFPKNNRFLGEDLPYDRDRWMPEPPGRVVDLAEEEIPELEEEIDDEADPLGLTRIDAAIRAERNRETELTLSAGDSSEGWHRPVDELRSSGFVLLPPAELTDEAVCPKLWELLHHLACRGFYLLHTDHFTDRDLYVDLWNQGLRDEAFLPGRSRTGGWFHDLIGDGNEEHTKLWLRFYASEEDRVRHARDWPDETMPARESPVASRDWRLPKGPF